MAKRGNTGVVGKELAQAIKKALPLGRKPVMAIAANKPELMSQAPFAKKFGPCIRESVRLRCRANRVIAMPAVSRLSHAMQSGETTAEVSVDRAVYFPELHVFEGEKGAILNDAPTYRYRYRDDTSRG